MKKQRVLCSLFIIILLFLSLTGNVLATNNQVESNTIDEARNLLEQMQPNNQKENIDIVKERIVIVIVAITIALIFILIIWKYETSY